MERKGAPKLFSPKRFMKTFEYAQFENAVDKVLKKRKEKKSKYDSNPNFTFYPVTN